MEVKEGWKDERMDEWSYRGTHRIRERWLKEQSEERKTKMFTFEQRIDRT